MRFLLGVLALVGVLLTGSPAEPGTSAQRPAYDRDAVLASCCLPSDPAPADAPRFVAGAASSGVSARDASIRTATLVGAPPTEPVAAPARVTSTSIPRPHVRTFPLLI